MPQEHRPNNLLSDEEIQHLTEMAADSVVDQPCLLCGGPQHTIGVFVPTDDNLVTMGFSLKGNKGVSVAHAICANCAKLPDLVELVRAEVLSMGASLREEYMRGIADPNNN